MASYEEPFSDIKELFDGIMDKTDLKQVINVKVLVDDNLKQVGKVVKANDLVKHMTGKDAIVVVNQFILEQLTEEQQLMVAEELLAGISYDYDEDKMVISKGDIHTYSGLLRKYGYDQYEVLQESVKTLYQAKKEMEQGG